MKHFVAPVWSGAIAVKNKTHRKWRSLLRRGGDGFSLTPSQAKIPGGLNSTVIDVQNFSFISNLLFLLLYVITLTEDSHVGKTEKLWTSVSLKPHQRKILEVHLGIKWSTENVFDNVIDHVIRQPYCFFLILQKSSSQKWLNRLRPNFTLMTTYPWGTKVSQTWCHRSHGLAVILDLP